jgi:hypothetical protein
VWALAERTTCAHEALAWEIKRARVAKSGSDREGTEGAQKAVTEGLFIEGIDEA